MAGVDPGSARQEAERLVATLLAGVQLARAGGDGSGWGPLGEMVGGVFGHTGSSGNAPGGRISTGSAECCVCPVCRGIAALRDPSPEFAERLATGAGDLAAGVASLLRAFATATPAADPATTWAPEPSTSDVAPSHSGEPTSPSYDAVPDGDARPPSADNGGPAVPADGVPAARSGDEGDRVWREATRTRHDSQPAPEPDVWAVATGAASPVGADPRIDVRPGPVPASRPSGAVAHDGPGDDA